MGRFVPLLLARLHFRPRQWLCATAIAFIATFLLIPSAYAGLPNQEAVDKALKDLTDAEQSAKDNVPGNSRVKAAEDALDAATRANAETSNDNPTTKAQAETAEADARATADNLREELKDRTTTDQKARNDAYREALRKRRAARQELKKLLAELQLWLRNRRSGIGETQELEDAINELRPRIGRSESIIEHSPSTAALIPFGSTMVNVSTDAQTYCTFGQANPTPISFAPADGSGNPLPAMMLTSLPLMAPGGAKLPEKAGNPEDASKADKPQGGNAAAPQSGSSAPQASPQAQPGSTAPTPENLGPGALGVVADVLFGSDKKASEPSGAPTTTSSPEPPSILDEDIVDSEYHGIPGYPTGNLTAEERAAKAFGQWIRDRLTLGPHSLNPQPSGLTPMEKFMLYHQYLRELQERGLAFPQRAETLEERVAKRVNPAPTPGTVPPAGSPQAGINSKGTAEYGSTSPGATLEPVPAPGSTPQINPEMLKKPWERADAFPTPPGAGMPIQKSDSSAQPTPKEKQFIEKSFSLVPGMTLTPTSDVTIHIKATQAVLEGQSSGTALKGEVVKLVALQEPALPKTGTTLKTALDKGFDKPPVTCTTGADGQCKAQLAGDDREIYGFPATGLNYRAELALKKNTGAVLQKSSGALTPAQLATLEDVPSGAQLVKSNFKIGDKTFTRIGVAASDAITADLLAKHSKTFGPQLQTDFCGEKKPGPPLGMEPLSYSALNSELPQARISLRLSLAGGKRR